MRNSTYASSPIIETRPLPYQLVSSPNNMTVKKRFFPSTMSPHPYAESDIVQMPMFVQKELQLVEDTSKIDSLQTQMKLLIDQNNYFQSQLEVARNRPPLIQQKIHIVEDTSKIELLNHQFINLLEESKNINSKNLNKEEENIMLNKQVNQLSYLHKQAEQEKKLLKSNINDISEGLEQVRSMNKILQQQNQVSTNKIDSLQRSLSQYLDELKQKNQELDYSNRKIYSMEDELKEMKNLKLNLSLMESYNQDKMNKLSELEKIKYVLTIEGVDREKYINELAFKIEHKNDTIQDLSLKLQEYQKTLNKSEDFIQSQSAIIKQQIADRNKLFEENSKNIINLEDRIRQLKELQLQLNNSEITLKQKNIEIAEQENYKNVILREGSEKDKEIIDQSLKIEELTDSITQLQQTIMLLQKDIQKQESYINTQANIISKNAHDNSELMNDNAQKNSELLIKTKKLEQDKEEIENLERMMDQKKRKIQDLEDQLNSRNTEVNQNQREIHNLGKQIEELNSTITTNMQKIILMQENLNKQEKYISNQSNTIQSQIKENNSVNQLFSILLLKMHQHLLLSLIFIALKSFKYFNQKMAEEINKKSSLLKLLQNESNDLKVQVEMLETTNSQKIYSISELENNKMKLIADCENKEDQIEDLMSQMDEKQKALTTLQQTITNMQESISNSEKLIFNQSNIIKEQIEEIQKLYLQSETYATAIVDQESHIKGLNHQIDSLLNTKQEMEMEIEHLKSHEQRISSLHQKLEDERQQTHLKMKENDHLLNKISKLELQIKKQVLFTSSSSQDDDHEKIKNKEITIIQSRFQVGQTSPVRNIMRKNQQVMDKADQVIRSSSLLKYSQIKNSSQFTPTKYVK